MNILIVDDEKDLLDILENEISDAFEDSTIYLAQNGQQALDIEATYPLDVIITDYRMPIMNGFELVEQVRNKGRNKDVPFIFISGFLPDFEESVETMDNVFLLDKPLKFSTLETYLNRISKNSKR